MHITPHDTSRHHTTPYQHHTPPHPSIFRYSAFNVVYQHAETKAKLFVGGAATASNRAELEFLDIKHIVYCQTDDGKCYFEDDPAYTYLKVHIMLGWCSGMWGGVVRWVVRQCLGPIVRVPAHRIIPVAPCPLSMRLVVIQCVYAHRSTCMHCLAQFPIATWHNTLGSSPTPGDVRNYFTPLFQFVETSLAEGNNVYVHCLAGAHRAGTAGVACLMYLCGLNSTEAVGVAKKLRPAINPIGSFPALLELLNRAMAEGAGSRGGSDAPGEKK